MWGEVDDKKKWLKKAIAFTENYKEFGCYMLIVVNEWEYSCENALTDNTLNIRAWIGQAACALGIGCPEDITRQAWGFLSDEQQFLANKEADRAIGAWINNRKDGRSICKNMGGQMLFEWHT
jgi:hypothetical protein